jgi:hypothetical protein
LESREFNNKTQNASIRNTILEGKRDLEAVKLKTRISSPELLFYLALAFVA